MFWSRRDFLFSLISAGGLTACQSGNIQFANSLNSSNLGRVSSNKYLIIIELAGGNDGLNTVIPYTDAYYYQLRPQISLSRERIIKIDQLLGLNEALTGAAQLYKRGEVAIIQNLGYPSPSFSHFRSTALWHVGGDGTTAPKQGWIASAAQKYRPKAAAHGISFSDEMGYFHDKYGVFLSAKNVEQIKSLKIRKIPASRSKKVLVSDISKRLNTLNNSVAILKENLVGFQGKVEFSNGLLSKQLQQVVEVIQSGASVPIFAVKLSSFDTHESQIWRHRSLLKELDRAIMQTRRALVGSGHWDDTIILTTSEFGRTPIENKSRGTDHGSAAPHFLFGGGINGGIYGKNPRLNMLLSNRNIQYMIDYRAVYDLLIRKFFRVNSDFIKYKADILENICI